jgi:hypothetical protein
MAAQPRQLGLRYYIIADRRDALAAASKLASSSRVLRISLYDRVVAAGNLDAPHETATGCRAEDAAEHLHDIAQLVLELPLGVEQPSVGEQHRAGILADKCSRVY